MKNIILALSLLISGSAFAQDSVNSHDFQLVPSDGDLSSGLATWSADEQTAGAFAGTVLFEYGRRPLTLHTQDSQGHISSDIIDSYSALNLGLFYSPHKRLALTASAPLFLAVDGTVGRDGVGIGDVRLAAPVGLVIGGPARLSAVPFVDVPGVYSDGQMGLSGVAGGGLLALSSSSQRVFGSANLGLQFAPEISYYNIEGGERLLSSLMGGVHLSDRVAVRGEVVFTPALYKNDEPMSDSPLEAMLSLQGQTDERLSWTVGASSALTESVGAPTWRAFAGLNVAFGARDPETCFEGCIGSLVITEGPGVGGYIGEEQGELDGGDFYLEDGEVFVVECPEPEPETVIVTENELILLEPIYFDFDRDTIRFPDSSKVLDALVETLEEHPELALVEVGGHTDSRGSSEYNESLSQARVESVVEYLVEHGISEDRLRPVGYGERALLTECSDDDESCHQKNRRVQFTILERR